MGEINICRVCLNESDLLINFMDLLSASPYQVTILESFNICTHLEAYENDLYSQSLCTECLDSLRISFGFIIKAEESDRLLKEKYSNNFGQLEIKYDDELINLKENNVSIQVEEINNKYVDKSNPYNVSDINEDHSPSFRCKDNDKRKKSTSETSEASQRLKKYNVITATATEIYYNCEICYKQLATDSGLRKHMRIHTGEKPYACEVCNQRFAFAYSLTCHKRIHTGERPYECEYCGKQFNQNTILKTHLTLHTGKTIECSLCDKKFSRKSNLILHQRAHSGEKPYLCHICDNKYLQKCHLDRHLEVHANIKFKCKLCDKEYSKKSSLKCHMFEHTGNKPYECTDCFQKFSRKDKFNSHLIKKHNKICNKKVSRDVS